MTFEWKNAKDDIYVCNDGMAQVQPGNKPGTYQARVYSNGSVVAEIEFSSLALAKQAVEIQLKKLASATAG